MNTNSTAANGLVKPSKPTLWTHSDPDSTCMAGFMHRVNQNYNLKLKTYGDLYKWSIENIAPFWGEIWNFTGIVAEKNFDEVSSVHVNIT
jgi:acetoacetyl-CoA synthetase